MADVLIAGGGIAGSTLAMLLGRRGVSVELYERGHFPREKPCGEGLMPAGVAVLERLGLREAVGGQPFAGVRYHAGSLIAAGRFPEAGGHAHHGVGQRRWIIDDVLFNEAAATTGVVAHVGCRVDRPLLEGRRVLGCEVNGAPRRAPLLVVADGWNSRLRTQLGLDGPAKRRARVGVRRHFCLAAGREQPPWVEVFLGDRHELYVTPLPDGEVLVAGLAERALLQGRADDALASWIAAQPVLADRLAGAQPLTRIAGRSPLTRRATAGVGPGVVLLGDAAGAVDPITGGGMAQALVTAELLADHIVRGLGSSESWLGAFEAERRALLRDYRRLTRFVLTLADHPKLARLALALFAAQPTALSHLVGVAAGMRPLMGPR